MKQPQITKEISFLYDPWHVDFHYEGEKLKYIMCANYSGYGTESIKFENIDAVDSFAEMIKDAYAKVEKANG